MDRIAPHSTRTQISMAQSKEDIKHGAAQAKLSEDEMLRVRYKHGTPLEGGKIADSEPVDLFSGAGHVAAANASSRQQEGHKIAESKPRDAAAGRVGETNPSPE